MLGVRQAIPAVRRAPTAVRGRYAELRAYQAPWRGEAEATIPNVRFPSDHVPVAVALRVK